MDQNLLISIGSIVISGLISFIVASVRIGVYKNKVDTNCTDISDHKKEIKEIRDKVIACETSLKEREPLVRRRSPVDLTDRGRKILVESGGQKFIDDNYGELKEKVQAKNPETHYDIQEVSKQIIDEVKNDDRINPIKEYLFREGMELGDIVVVLGIYLRNKILEEKGLKIKDIDKYDPSAKAGVSEPA